LSLNNIGIEYELTKNTKTRSKSNRNPSGAEDNSLCEMGAAVRSRIILVEQEPEP
jgi:hypothetical protein